MNVKTIIFILGILWGLSTNLNAQTPPPPSMKVKIDYIIPRLEILNKELLACLDTLSLSTTVEKKPYLIFYFSSNEEAGLYLNYQLPPVIIESDVIVGFLDYKGYTMIVTDNPPPGWFKTLPEKKRFKGYRYLMFGDGSTIWHFTFSNKKVIEVRKSIME